MNAFSPVGAQRRAALAGAACVVSLSLLSSVLLLFDSVPPGAWSGLDARQHQPNPTCAPTGVVSADCRIELASAASAPAPRRH